MEVIHHPLRAQTLYHHVARTTKKIEQAIMLRPHGMELLSKVILSAVDL
jgi:hypothetical protein